MIPSRLAASAALILAFAATGGAAAPGGGVPPSATHVAAKVTPEATQAIQRMAAYLKTLTTFQLTSVASNELVLDDGQKLQTNGTVKYKVRRPDGFVINSAWDRKGREYVYDGKKLSVYAPDLGFYGQAPAPPTIRRTLQEVDDKYGIQLPLADLFNWGEAGGEGLDRLTSGFLVGGATVNGVATDHYMFRQPGIDWQIWIQRGAQPLPLKIVITDRNDPARPQYVATLTWNVKPAFTADTFTFRPAANAHPIRLATK